MTLLENYPEFWGQWNRASLTTLSKKDAEIKVGIRKGLALKGLFALKKYYELKKCSERPPHKAVAGTPGTLIGNLFGWLWLRSEIYPKHLKFLHPYLFSHPRPLGRSFSDFLWEEMVKLGQCTLTQGDVSVKHKNTVIRSRWKVHEGNVYGIVKRIAGNGKIQLEILGVKCKTYPEPLEIKKEKYYKIHIFEDSVHYSTSLSANVGEIERIFSIKEDIPYSTGARKSALEGITTIIGINSLKTPDRGWLTSLMRRFDSISGGWDIYMWDDSFIGMISTLAYPQLAKGNIKALCSELTHDGFIPNQANPRGRAEGITQVPVTSYCALKINRILGADMSDVIPALESNNNYWIKTHNPNGFHLLSYGSMLKQRCNGALRQTAIYEAGMDNHPIFDKVPMDYNSGCMAMYSVGLNGVYAMDCWSLSNLAKAHGNQKLADKLMIRYRNMKKVINKHLWDGETYRNRYWNGDFQDDITPNYLWPLFAGVATQERAESSVKIVLKRCLTPYGISNCPKDHPAFQQQISWRGRLLPPIQYITSESLRRYELDLEASDLARRTYRCFAQEWEQESHTHESYNGMTGDGDDVSITGEPCHPWATMMGYLAVQDFIDYEVWNDGIRLGRIKPINASMNDIPILGNKYSVKIDKNEQTIVKNNEILAKSSYPLIMRKFLHEKNNVSFKYKTLKSLELKVIVKAGNYEVSIGKEQFKEQVDKSESITLSLKQLENEISIKKV